MKKLLCLALLWTSLVSSACAETWLTIGQLREQTPARWTQTYETPWRTVSIDAEISVPHADQLPVVLLRGGASEPDWTAAEMDWDGFRYAGAYSLSVFNHTPSYPKSVDGVRLGSPVSEGSWYSGFAPENRYVPLDDITFGEIAGLTKAAIRKLGYDPDAFLIDEPVRLWTHHVYAYGKKKDVLPGYMFMEVLPVVQGVPVLSHIQEAVRGHTGTALGDSEFWQPVTTTIGYNGYYGGLSSILLTPMAVCETIADDVPLLPFSRVLEALEEEIAAGRIRKIYEIRLGYVLYNEPGKFHTASPGKARAAEGHAARFYARPMWQVNCLYAETAAGKLRRQPDDMDDERNTLDYCQLLIDPQTAGVVTRTNARDRCEYKAVLRWEDVP